MKIFKSLYYRLVTDDGEVFIVSEIKNSSYFKLAVKNFADLKMLCIAAIVVSLRVVLRLVRIPVGADLYISFDCFVNSVGSMVYGPLVALAVGAVSDTLGAILIPQGPYFFPFIFTEMSSSFIFALFLWNREKLSVNRIVLSRFTVNMICNIIMTSAIMKWWYYPLFFSEKTYYFFNTLRIAKNLILFPIEGILMAVLINALAPALAQLKLINKNTTEKPKKKDIIFIAVLAVLSVALVAVYILYISPFLQTHKIELF